MTRKRTSENRSRGVCYRRRSPGPQSAATRPRAKRAAEPLAPLAPADAGDRCAPVDAPVLATVYAPTNEEIAKLAYLYWEARGCQGGSPEEDWLRAEEELRNRSPSLA